MKFQNKTFSMTPDSVKDLERISKLLKEPSLSAAIRHCVRQEYKRLAAKKRAANG